MSFEEMLTEGKRRALHLIHQVQVATERKTLTQRSLRLHALLCSPRYLSSFLSFVQALLESWVHWPARFQACGNGLCLIPHVWTQFQNESLPVERNRQRNIGNLFSSVHVQIKDYRLSEFGITRQIFPPGSIEKMKFLTIINVKLISCYKAPFFTVWNCFDEQNKLGEL